MRSSFKSLTIIFIVLFLLSCHGNINRRLQAADMCLNHNQVDSTYNILKKINVVKLKNKEDLALYTLLYTESRYRKYVPIKDDSIDYAISYYEKNGPNYRLAEAYNYKGIILYYYSKMPQKAILFLKKAEDIAIKTNDLRLKQKIEENICTVNMYTYNYRQSLKYGMKALNSARFLKDKLSIAYDYSYLSTSYAGLGNKDSALICELKIIPYLKYFTKSDRSILLSTLGDLYIQIGSYDKSEEFLNKAFAISPTAYTYSLLANIYIKRGEYSKARRLMVKAPKSTTYEEKYKVLSTLYNLNRKSGDYRHALDVADSIIILNHAMDSVKEHDNLNEIQAKFDREQTAQEFKTRIVYLVGGLVLLTLLALFFIFRQKYKVAKMQHDMMKKRLLINEYTDRIKNMENEHSESTAQIKDLKKKVSNLEKAESEILFNGKRCYEALKANTSIVKWSTPDLHDFIDYYRLVDLPYVSGLEDEYCKLTPKQIIYMIIVNRMSKDETEVEKIMGVSSSTVRSMKSRIKARKYRVKP